MCRVHLEALDRDPDVGWAGPVVFAVERAVRRKRWKKHTLGRLCLARLRRPRWLSEGGQDVGQVDALRPGLR